VKNHFANNENTEASNECSCEITPAVCEKCLSWSTNCNI